MPNSNTTAVIDSSSTTGQPAPLCYGFVWVTGKRLEYFELQNTGNTALDFSRVGMWCLGEGEWDGCEELWINDQFVWENEYADPTQFHFHRGTDAPIGSGLNGYSSGPDQGCDSFWQWFPSGSQPLCFSRLAYYSIFRKQPIQNQTNTHQYDPTQWTDINPVGLWRAMRVRIFDDQGNQTGYAFSNNPVWCLLDAWLRRKYFNEFRIDINTGIDPIPSPVANCFNWGDIWSTAQYCDQLLANGRRRFTFNGAFSSQTTLAAITSQILMCFRGFTRSYAGKMSILCDQPRSSVFTITREHVLGNSLAPGDSATTKAANAYVGHFRDVLVPAAASISGITCENHANPVVTTEAPHPFNTGDRVAIGGTDTIYDGTWVVQSVPAGSQVTSLTLQSKGSNYPSSVGAGGQIGLTQARFKERSPTFMHKANQLARGAVAVGVQRYQNPIPVTYDLATSTFDQVSRICRYERDRALGFDVTPYVTPPALRVKIPLFALSADGSGNCAAQIEAGDRITIDTYASYAYQGDYEVLETVENEYVAQFSATDGSITLRADPSGGTKELTLGPYNETYMYDVTDPNSASWSNVPGSDPGNDGNYTAIDLANNGKLAFITGAVSSGSTFDLPSTGFTPSNLLAAASPQGYIEKGHVMHVIEQCNIDSNRNCTLNYEDGEGNIWNGDLNVAAVTWLGSSAATSTDGTGMAWLVATLAGGEIICIGVGVVADSTQLAIPAGFSWSKAFALASPHDGIPNGNQASGYGAYVDSLGVVHCTFQDNSGNSWHTNAVVLVFGWQNNSGQVSTQTTGGANWMNYTTSTGFVLGVGAGTFADGATMGLPSTAGAADSLQIFSAIHGFTLPEPNPAHGVGANYVDANLVVHAFFEDGDGHLWSATSDVFALYYEPTGASGTSAGGISVLVSPSGASVALGGSIQFSAYVSGSSNTSVNWSVDGVAGGNATVGTIDGTGLYTAPSTSGTHAIMAASQANSAATSTQYVAVGSGSGSNGGSTVQVSVTPFSISIAAGTTQQFTASVTGSSNTAVTWSVDGIAGGNSTVGTISTSGLYTAPTSSGSHTITATSQAVASSAGSATVAVGSGGGSSPPPTRGTGPIRAI
jgi:hypothetical protein